ncbi:Nudix (Nucleoside diphosphate linked moiety X)-type motif 1 [Mortierella sp. GBA35]|nr:Nudix (Nucleoside diphosphate linked moiety X)-type motif 1 [Mortierella sp. GBA35]
MTISSSDTHRGTAQAEEGMTNPQGMVDPKDSSFDLSFLPIRKIFTLIFIHDLEHHQLLLGQKQRGPLLGQWNGFGGKVEKGQESITESAARELQEEAFLTAPLFPIGFIQWVVESNNDPAYRDIMIVYKAHSLQQLPSTTTTTTPSHSEPQHDQEQQQQQTSDRVTEFQASDEMAPAWWDIDRLPWENMRINHKVWYPFLLADRPYRGVYWYETRSSVDEGAANAQRETVKEIWIEDLAKRCVQFGDRPLPRSSNGSRGRNDSQDDNGEMLEMYARQLELYGSCYLSGGREDKEVDRAEPSVNRLLDDRWLQDTIAEVEQDWLATHFT